MARKFNHPTRRMIQRRRDQTAAICMMVASLLAFGAMLYGMHAIDTANGITVSQSLSNWGL